MMRSVCCGVLVGLTAALAVAGCGGSGGSTSISGGGSGALPVATPGGNEPGSSGQVRVIDADTVDIDETRFRLFGIDAPESNQTCRAWGWTWDCGAAATEALASRAAGMSCTGSETDRYGRSIGVCSSGGEDLNAWLVANGWALAYRQYAEDYVSQEEDARSNGRGIHRGEFVEPWNWRRGERIGGTDSFASIASGMLDVGNLADRMLRGDDEGFFGHWLDDSVFGLVNDAVAVSFGGSADTNPSGVGGAVWRGAMVGLEGSQRVEGEAEISIDDVSAPVVDVALTGISDAGGGTRPDLEWQGLSLVEGGFQANGADGSIEGRFYGSAHGEVGGIFESNRIVGAFGAARE